MTTNPSNITDPSNVDPNSNPPVNVTNPTLNVSQGTPTIEELQAQLDAFKQSNFDLREKERKRKEQEAADKAALEAKLKEQGEFKTLAEQLQSTVNDLQSQITQRDQEIAKRDYEALRAKVASQHGLSPELAVRLSGQTEEELNNDATALKKLIGETTPARPGNGRNPTPGGQGPSREQQKESLKQEWRQRGTRML
jgi:hypothetical protein